MSDYEQRRAIYFEHVMGCQRCNVKPGYRVRYLTINPCPEALRLVNQLLQFE